MLLTILIMMLVVILASGWTHPRHGYVGWSLPGLVLLFGAVGCMVSPAGDRGMRSPTLDYPPPPVQTADGQVLGADGVRPEDKVRMGPRLGTDGIKPSESPKHAEPPGPAESARDPRCDALAVDEAARKERCKGAEPKSK